MARMVLDGLRHPENSYQNHSLVSDFDQTEWKLFELERFVLIR